MANPLFNQLANQPIVNNGVMQFIRDVQQFQSAFSGDPKQEVQNLLNSGKLSQAQFNEFAQIANQLVPYLSK